jgi:hypothetical protein
MLVGVTKLHGDICKEDRATMDKARIDALYTSINTVYDMKNIIYVICEKLEHVDIYTEKLYKKITPLYAAGHRHFELHHRPNSSANGYGWTWANGSQFSIWFCEVYKRLKSVFPDILIGYPKLSYGPDIGLSQVAHDKFLIESHEAVEQSDFISVLVHWKSRDFNTAIFDAVHYLAYVRYIFDKDIVGIYFNNNNNVQKSMKGHQYLTFINYVRKIDGVIGLFGHVLSSPSKEDMWITWRSQNSESSIPSIIASREW